MLSVLAPPPKSEGRVGLLVPSNVVEGQLLHTLQDRLFPEANSTPVIVPIPIRKAITAGINAAPIMERLRRVDRFENQFNAARNRPMKLFLKSGRPGGLFPVGYSGSLVRDARSRTLPGARRTFPVTLCR